MLKVEATTGGNQTTETGPVEDHPTDREQDLKVVPTEEVPTDQEDQTDRREEEDLQDVLLLVHP
jgi:hypothetical protein